MMRKEIMFLLTLSVAVLSSCSYSRNPNNRGYDPNDTGFEYVPDGDMYYSVPYDPMTQYIDSENPYNKDSINMRMPPQGTVARGRLTNYYPYPNNNEGYEMAGTQLKNPIPATPTSIAEGKRYYNNFCSQCHGSEASGKGSMVAAGKYPPPTWDFERQGLIKTLPEGKMYHSITFGRNLMGPHGPLLRPEERWMIINYLKNVTTGAAATATTDTTAAPVTQTDTTKTVKQ